MFETETVGPGLVRKLKWKLPWPPGPFSGHAPVPMQKAFAAWIDMKFVRYVNR